MIKKFMLLSLFLLGALLQGNAQGFEGILRWKVSTQSQSVDPVTGMPDHGAPTHGKATGAGSSRTPGQGAPDSRQAARANMIPKEMTMKVQNGNTRIEMEGGMAPVIGDILYLRDKNQTYSISRSARTYHLLTPAGERRNDQPTYKVTKTDERTRILNYDCVKYLVEMQNGPQTATQVIWASPDFKEIDAKTLQKLPIGRQGELSFLKDIQGTPLRIEMRAFGANMVAELAEVRKEKLDAADFTLPAGYQELEKGGMGR